MRKIVHKCFDCQSTHINNSCPYCKSNSFASIEVSENEYEKINEVTNKYIENSKLSDVFKFCEYCGHKCLAESVTCENCHKKFEKILTDEEASIKRKKNRVKIISYLGIGLSYNLPGFAAIFSFLAIYLDREEKGMPFKLGFAGILFNTLSSIYFYVFLLNS